MGLLSTLSDNLKFSSTLAIAEHILRNELPEP